MKKPDLNDIAKIEQAIAEKYGPETIQNPRSGWTKEKELEYLKQIKERFSQDLRRREDSEKINKDGFSYQKNYLLKTNTVFVLRVLNTHLI